MATIKVGPMTLAEGDLQSVMPTASGVKLRFALKGKPDAVIEFPDAAAEDLLSKLGAAMKARKTFGK